MRSKFLKKMNKEKAMMLTIYAFLIIWTIISILPFFLMVSTSLKTVLEATAMPIKWLPSQPSLYKYVEVLTTPYVNLPLATLNSIFVTVSVTILSVLLCSLAGYALAKKEFFAKDTIFFVVVGTMMIPAFVLIVPQFMIIFRLGMYDNLFGLILPWMAPAGGIFLMRQYITGIPTELEEAARADGYSELGIFFKIILPLSKPAIAILAIFTFIGNWNALLWPIILIVSKGSFTLQQALAYLYKTRALEAADYPLIMAGNVLALIPIFITFFVFRRYFIEGITTGGVKG